MAPYKRVLLKISGEALVGSQGFGIEQSASLKVASQVKELHDNGHEVAIVLGGGNFFRGIQQGSSLGIERTPADQMGMLATLINGVAFQQALLSLGCTVRLMTAMECPTVAETYQWEKAMRHLSKNRILIFVGGTGHPYFTTDTCAALRASEINADIFLKATTRVDGIYDHDPRLVEKAVKFDTINYREVLDRKLGILDLTAVAMCMTNKIPIRVFNFFAGPLLNAVSDQPYGTLVTGE